MKLISYYNKAIEYSFYALFLLIPLVFQGNTSELFEFNKMWLTFAITIIIALAWFSKMVFQRRFFIQRTPLDIPLALFLLSQILSTIFSLDQHVSWWGYYTRFNGGLLSTICYIFLYYAFVSNIRVELHGNASESHKQTHNLWQIDGLVLVKRLLAVSLLSGLIVVLWGIPSHFGYDPTCLVFRGNFDTTCWTEAFKPTIRVFSTLGQPAWLAAYLAVLIPLTMAFALKNVILQESTHKKNQEFRGNIYLTSYFLLLTSLFYLCLIFANTRAGFIAFGFADVVLWSLILVKKLFSKKQFTKYFLFFHLIFLLCNFFFGAPIGSLDKFTFHELINRSNSGSQSVEKSQSTQKRASQTEDFGGGVNITDSGKIRLLVWKGAVDVWRANPLFGTGVETFAFAYYKFKSPEHNLTSEWDYLYNKAHNEYLNYLATTGLFGLGSYILIILVFLWVALRNLQNLSRENSLLVLALIAGFVSILVSNFFGFSVVIINLYFFLIPVFVFMLEGVLNPGKALTFSLGSEHSKKGGYINPYQWTVVGVFIIICVYFLLSLFRYWYADIAYALGNNLDKIGSYQEAFPQLKQAIEAEPNEPVYKDEFSINMGTLAAGLFLQKDSTNGAQFATQAINLNNQVVESHPQNVVYWKNRVRLFYTLAQGDPDHQQVYSGEALRAIIKAYALSPQDAKISYNLGVLYGQAGDQKKAIEALKRTTTLKPNYRDAYFALGLFYHQLAVDKNNKVINPQMQAKAVETYRYILEHISPNDKQTKETLKSWEKS